MAFMTENKGLSLNKVVEVIAETTAPQLPFDELLAKVPPDSPVNFVEVVCCTFLICPLYF